MSKTVQKSGAQPAVRQDSHAVYPTHYAVKIHSLRLEGSCRATASVNINGCFAVRGIKVMDSSKGLFVSMPSYRAGNGEYKDICFSCTKEARMEFDSAVLDAYQQALVQAQAQSQRWSGRSAMTGCAVREENSALCASAQPTAWRANSMTAICIPRQMPR